MPVKPASDTRPRIPYLDLLRIAAICVVMILHIAYRGKNETDVHTLLWTGKNFFNGFSRWGVGVLVMVSGALFLGRDIPLKKLYGKYILRIVLAFLFWSFAYAFVFYYAGSGGREGFLWAFASGHYHLWFLFMIAGLYAVVPFLRRIVQDEKLTVYFLVLSFIFAFVLPQSVTLIQLFSPDLADKVSRVFAQFQLHFVLGYTFYFVLGYWLSKTTLSRKAETVFLVLGAAGFIATILGNYAVSVWKGQSGEYIFENNMVNVALQAVGVFVLFKKLFGSKKAGKLLPSLSKYSFGAYLLHAGVISTVDKFFHLNADSFNPFLSIPLVFLLTCILSFALSALLNHIPVIKKYLV